MTRLGHLIAALLLLLCATVARADIAVDVLYGHGQRGVTEAATPVEVRLTNSGNETVQVEIVIDRSGLAGLGTGAMLRRTVVVPGGVTRRELFLVEGTGFASGLEVRLATSPRTPLRTRRTNADRGTMTISVQDEYDIAPTAVPMEGRVLGVVGGNARTLLDVVSRVDEDDRSGRTWISSCDLPFALRVEAENLAAAPFSIEGLDTLLVLDPDASFAEDPKVETALLDWVALGGRLVVSLGSNASSFGTSPLARAMPARWTHAERVLVADLLPFGLKDDEAATSVSIPTVPLLATERAGDLIRPGRSGRAVAASRTHGRGVIELLPYDLSEVPRVFKDREGADRRTFVDQVLLPLRVSRRSDLQRTTEMTQSIHRIDLADWSGRILRQDAFAPPPLPLVLLGLVAYVLLVGPVDWLILKRLRKERLTTITFAALVTAFTVIAYGSSLFLFSTGAVVNRVALIDLVDAGDGRQLVRTLDIAGYYAPTGDTLELDPEGECLIVPGSLPTTAASGEMGRALELIVDSRRATDVSAELGIGFRSQRVIRTTSLAEFGRSIDVTWSTGPDGSRRLELTNTLPVDLSAVTVLLPDRTHFTTGALAAGATVGELVAATRTWPGLDFARSPVSGSDAPRRADVFGLFAFASVAEALSLESGSEFGRLTPEELVALQKSGIDLTPLLERGHALLLALAEDAPVELPYATRDGQRYVVIRKEIPLR